MLNVKDIEILQSYLNRSGDWSVENEMKIYPSKSKAISFTRVRVKDTLNYALRDQNIPEANCYEVI
jgi:hypothetical protein